MKKGVDNPWINSRSLLYYYYSGNQKQTMETAKTENWQKSDAFLKSVASKKNKKLPSETLIEAKHPSWEVIKQPLVVSLGENGTNKTTT